MVTPQIRARVAQLRAQITRDNKAYYIDHRPQVTDAEYDNAFAELTRLEAAHPELKNAGSPTQTVGVTPSGKNGTVEHRTPMLSIDNTYEEAGVDAFASRMGELLGQAESEIEYSVEPKFDGLALSAIYTNGQLVGAGTRGTHEVGEDVLATARAIRNLPHILPADAGAQRHDIRGEVVLPIAAFNRLNAEMIERGEEPYATCRNAAAGILGQSDVKRAADAGLLFIAYGMGTDTIPSGIKTQRNVLDYLQRIGIPVSPNTFVKHGITDVKKLFEKFAEHRHELPYDIDGVVVKINNLADQAELGYVSRAPRGMMAYKFNQQEAWTRVLGIDVQIGRTGAVTPVARLAPIEVGGVMVSNATLHNEDEIRRKNVMIGDVVLVRRGGDVIPDLVEVDLAKRPSDASEFHMPGACPCCKSPVIKPEDEAIARCTGGLACDEQRKQSLIYFASRPCMDIDGLGEKLIEQLFTAGVVREFADIFRLTRAQLMKFDRMGDKKAQNILDAIEASRGVTPRNFLQALGIRHAAEGTAKRLEAHFGSVDAVLAASLDDIMAVDDIGPTVGKSVSDYLRQNEARVRELASFMRFQEKQKASDALAGKTIVVTGTLTQFKREEIKGWIESHGGKTSDSVSKKTSYLVCGEAAGTKLAKARALGVLVISETDLLDLTNDAEQPANRPRMRA